MTMMASLENLTEIKDDCEEEEEKEKDDDDDVNRIITLEIERKDGNDPRSKITLRISVCDSINHGLPTVSYFYGNPDLRLSSTATSSKGVWEFKHKQKPKKVPERDEIMPREFVLEGKRRQACVLM